MIFCCYEGRAVLSILCAVGDVHGFGCKTVCSRGCIMRRVNVFVEWMCLRMVVFGRGQNVNCR